MALNKKEEAAEAEKERVKALKAQLEDVRQAINHGPTRRMLVRIFFFSGWLQNSFSPNQAIQSHNTGQDKVLRTIMNDISMIQPEGPTLVGRLEKEIYEYRDKLPDRPKQQ